jgi:hypothetical protein
VKTEVSRSNIVRTRPDPKIAHVLRHLIGKEDAGE